MARKIGRGAAERRGGIGGHLLGLHGAERSPGGRGAIPRCVFKPACSGVILGTLPVRWDTSTFPRLEVPTLAGSTLLLTATKIGVAVGNRWDWIESGLAILLLLAAVGALVLYAVAELNWYFQPSR